MNSPYDFASPGSNLAPEIEAVRPGGVVIPPLKITAEACCVTRTPSGAIQCLDWVCILGRTFRQTFEPVPKTMTLELYHGQILHLDQEQTRHLIEYLGIIDRGDGGEWIHSRRSPRPFLDIVEPLLAGRDTPHEATAPTEAKP